MKIFIPRINREYLHVNRTQFKDSKSPIDISIISTLKKSKRHIQIESAYFLDEFEVGDKRKLIVDKLGEPMFIFNNVSEAKNHNVYSYRLKSGNKCLRVDIHFVDNVLNLGVIEFQSSNSNESELFDYLRLKYKIQNSNFSDGILIDDNNNIICFNYNNFILKLFYFNLNNPLLTNESFSE